MAPRVVVDTNVWVSGLILPQSVPGQVLQAIRDRRLEPVMSWQLAEEIIDVIGRPRLRHYGLAPRDVEDLLATMRPWLPTVDVDIAMRDPDDVPVVAAALAGNAQLIVTGDRDLLDEAETIGWLAERGIEVVTPAVLLDLLRG